MKAIYAKFLLEKSQDGTFTGFDPIWMPEFLFDFQAENTGWHIRKGKSAAFQDCGMGKTVQELVWGENVVRYTNKPVLLLTPLAVSQQTVREAAKFGIEAHRSTDGRITSGIHVSNYERLHYFNPSDFAGVVCDECFPPDTKVQTSLGLCYIKDIRAGCTIINACGEDKVAKVHRREVHSAVRISIERRIWRGPKDSDSITSSPNHPYFTYRGWVHAKDIQPGDRIMETNAAMRLVRSRHNSEDVPIGASGFLREILLREMADEPAGIQGPDLYSRAPIQSYSRDTRMVATRYARSVNCQEANRWTEPHDSPRGQGQSVVDIEVHEPSAIYSRRKRQGTHRTTDIHGYSAGAGMDHGVCDIVGEEDSRISNLLQNRRGQSREANSHRTGWKLPLLPQGEGSEEGCEAGFHRVESVEVLEPGHPDLERYRDDEGRIYFYDLSATRHPSFSVNGLLVHNSSAIKSFDGKRRAQVTEFLRTIPYRLLATATAAPNDYIELGTSAEALGVMGHVDMLNRFFKNDQNTSDTKSRWTGFAAPRELSTPGWRFKGHAETPFFRWVCSWARGGRKPSDFGPFSDDRLVLPRLVEREHVVETRTMGDGMLFPLPATNMQEEREERRRTIQERCEMAAQLVAGTGKPFVIWCHLNDEGDLLEKIIPDALQVSGADSDEAKEEAYEAFGSGQSRGLITKQKIGGWGLNWQHCAHVLEFASHSFEQHYQGVRRCWRFGQKSDVINDIIVTEGERGVLENMKRKSAQADRMFSSLVEHMHEAILIESGYKFTENVEVPSWL